MTIARSLLVIPPAKAHECLNMGALEIAALIKKKQLSPVEVVLAHVERAAAVNAHINAIAVRRFDEALAEAVTAERALYSHSTLGALHGVPCSVKEGLSFKGLPYTSGSNHRRGNIASKNGTVVERIRLAGAIVIGLTNMSEMALWPESDNLVYGKTSNPYDLGRTAGGSSGGEAALIGAGGAAFGMGTDGGGSIRIPAAYCGVFGHKPSSQLVPLTGHLPLDDVFRAHPGAVAMARYFAAGPITKSAKDLMPLLQIMAGPDGIDNNVRPFQFGDPGAVDFRGKKVLVCEAPSVKWVGKTCVDMAESVTRAARTLEMCGARVEAWNHPFLRDAFDIWMATTLAARGPSMSVILGNGKPLSLIGAAMGAMQGIPNHTPGALLACVAERFFKPSSKSIQRYVLAGATLRKCLEKALGQDGLLLLPVTPRPAPMHGGALKHPFDVAYCALFNALELPATVAPVGPMANGLPGSVQLIGSHGSDHVTIAAAQVLESAFGWSAAGSVLPKPHRPRHFH